LNKSEAFGNAGLQTGVWRTRSGGFINADLKIGVPTGFSPSETEALGIAFSSLFTLTLSCYNLSIHDAR
jgi:hypothetical protein